MTDGPRTGEMAWRLEALERRAEKIEQAVEDLPVLEERITSLNERLRAIQNVLWTIAGGLVLLVVSVLFAAAQFGGA